MKQAKKKPGLDAEESDEEEDEDESGDSDLSEKEFRENLAQIQKLKKKMQRNKEHVAQEEDEEDAEDEEDEGEDSDYEYVAGDLAIYDSALDDVDELIFVKEALERISQTDQAYFHALMSAMNQQEMASFNETMNEAQMLREREEHVRKQCEAIDKKVTY